MMSPEMRAMATGLYYRGEKTYLRSDSNPLGKAFKENDKDAFNKALQEHYRKKGVADRAEKDAAFWKKRREAQQKEREKTGASWLSSNPKERIRAMNDYLNRWDVSKHGDGGALHEEQPQWSALSMREKSAYIGAAVRNGLTRL